MSGSKIAGRNGKSDGKSLGSGTGLLTSGGSVEVRANRNTAFRIKQSRRTSEHVVEFTQIESVFYLALFIAAGIGNLARQCCDNDLFSLRVWFGRCVSAGLFGGGVCAYRLGTVIGNDGSGGTFSAWLYIFASGIIGFCFIDIKDQLVKRLLMWGYKKLTGDEGKSD